MVKEKLQELANAPLTERAALRKMLSKALGLPQSEIKEEVHKLQKALDKENEAEGGSIILHPPEPWDDEVEGKARISAPKQFLRAGQPSGTVSRAAVRLYTPPPTLKRGETYELAICEGIETALALHQILGPDVPQVQG